MFLFLYIIRKIKLEHNLYFILCKFPKLHKDKESTERGRCNFACKTEGERERWKLRAAKMKNNIENYSRRENRKGNKYMKITLEKPSSGYKNFSALVKTVSKINKIYQRNLQNSSQVLLQKVLKITTRSSLASLTVALQGITHAVEDFWLVDLQHHLLSLSRLPDYFWL